MLVPKKHQDAFVAAVQKAYAQFYPEGPLHSSATLTGVHPSAHNRLKDLIASTQGELVVGGKAGEDGRIEPAVVKNVSVDDALMKR